ncbi:MAG: hypothetical protein GY938_27550 [Ketobacter sp.]|nr:hypothetical protein [Ketobacter sp.]
MIDQLKPFLYARWRPILGITVGSVCLLASMLPSSVLPFVGQLELAAKTESDAINVTLYEPWNWQQSIQLNTGQFVIDNVFITENPFLEFEENAARHHGQSTSGSLSITPSAGSHLYISYLQIPSQQRLNLSSINKSDLELAVRSTASDQPAKLKGKLNLIGSGEVCQTPLQGEVICHSVTPSKIRPDAPRSIHFQSSSTQFSLHLPIQSAALFENNSVSDIGYWKLGVARNFQEAPFSCGLLDGVLIFTVSDQSRDLWRTDCVTILGTNINITSDWVDGQFHSRIRGSGKTNSDLMPSVLQATIATPWISDIATAMGWIIAFISTLAFLRHPTLEG